MRTEPVQILVVDDSRDAADALALMLRRSGYQVRTAYTAEEALAAVAAGVPHCVLFDVVMPGMGGDELCRRLRAEHGDDIVLIAVSGFSDDQRAKASFRLADHFFTKPVEPAALARVLQPLE